jgi:hypothetical protein
MKAHMADIHLRIVAVLFKLDELRKFIHDPARLATVLDDAAVPPDQIDVVIDAMMLQHAELQLRLRTYVTAYVTELAGTKKQPATSKAAG